MVWYEPEKGAKKKKQKNKTKKKNTNMKYDSINIIAWKQK